MSTLFQILITAMLSVFSPQEDSPEEKMVKQERTEQLEMSSDDNCPSV